jgi:hypothetical protein
MGYTKWDLPENEQRLREAVASSTSVVGTAQALGVTVAGGNLTVLRRHIIRLGLDTSHHTGKAWNRGRRGLSRRGQGAPKPGRADATMKKYLIYTHGHRCMQCKNTEWMGRPIPLELEHKDGNHFNKDIDNVELLCCNCHALTPTWRRKK